MVLMVVCGVSGGLSYYLSGENLQKTQNVSKPLDPGETKKSRSRMDYHCQCFPNLFS